MIKRLLLVTVGTLGVIAACVLIFLDQIKGIIIAIGLISTLVLIVVDVAWTVFEIKNAIAKDDEIHAQREAKEKARLAELEAKVAAEENEIHQDEDKIAALEAKLAAVEAALRGHNLLEKDPRVAEVERRNAEIIAKATGQA